LTGAFTATRDLITELALFGDDTEQRAMEFCKRKGKEMESIRETTATPPFVLGNFPRVEIVFDCVNKPTAEPATDDDPKYTRLINLKMLLDTGVITQEEFDRE
jgi:hypothetical protein